MDSSTIGTVAVVSPGHMGGALGAALAAGGVRVVATVAGRSARTARLAADAGLEMLPSLVDVVAAAELVLSVAPPGQAVAIAHELAAAARKSGSRPLVADLNAIAPATVDTVAAALRHADLDLVDGAISGPPPAPGSDTPRIYLAGPRAGEIAGLAWPGVDVRVIGDRLGSASALKMCSASVYKGLVALGTQAMLTAHHHGVLDQFLAELELSGLGVNVPGSAAVAATKADRYVPEMREIASTQAGAGLTPALFEAMAEVWGAIAEGPLAGADPETVDRSAPADQVVAGLLPRRAPTSAG
jgi:3-hydroxyisobutyrate dehydrogenase-like beta-hydroxyacid dehydrogenase